jgi:hypothetical protein
LRGSRASDTNELFARDFIFHGAILRRGKLDAVALAELARLVLGDRDEIRITGIGELAE